MRVTIPTEPIGSIPRLPALLEGIGQLGGRVIGTALASEVLAGA